MDEILEELIVLRDGLTTLHPYWGKRAMKITEMYKAKTGQQEPITN